MLQNIVTMVQTLSYENLPIIVIIIVVKYISID